MGRNFKILLVGFFNPSVTAAEKKKHEQKTDVERDYEEVDNGYMDTSNKDSMFVSASIEII